MIENELKTNSEKKRIKNIHKKRKKEKEEPMN